MQSPHPLFDPDYYLANNPDVAATDADPFLHFVQHGAFERRNPHPLFDSSWYLDQNPDVANAKDNPLLHYVTHGWREGRNPHPDFDVGWYLAQNPDVAAAKIDPLTHYLRFGASEGRWANHFFDTKWYYQKYDDVRSSGANAFVHYIVHGRFEGRETQASDMRPADYLAAREDDVDKAIRLFLQAAYDVCGESGPLDALILLPLFGRGGAEKVALNFSRALREHRPDRTVILLVTDYEFLDREIALPKGIAALKLTDFLACEDWAAKRSFAFKIIQLLRPRICHIINSDVGWNVVREHGERLRKFTSLYGSMFSLQRDILTGTMQGYAAYYYLDATKYCNALLSDNSTFLEEARGVFCEPSNADLVTVYNAVSIDGEATTFVPYHPSKQTKILWAGRLDSDKRVELLFEVAAAMPDVMFFVFGSKVVDGDVNLSELANVTFGGPFLTPAELVKTHKYDAYILTTKGEGLPNIILEMGVLKIPVIAPAIGGIPEIIDEETGYLLSQWPNAIEYVAAIRDVLSNPSQAERKVNGLYNRLCQRHSWNAFTDTVQKIPGYL